MPAVTRVGDLDVVHCSVPARARGSGNVFVNGRPVSRQGDVNSVHLRPGGKGCPVHASAISSGSSTVKVNGVGVGRVGDSVSGCTSVAQGSSNVFAG